MPIQVISEHIEPERPERKLIAPQWVLDGPARAIVIELDPDGMLYRHQSIGLEKLSSPEVNLVISTGTASGKTLIFQITALDRLLRNPRETTLAIYPLKALSRDQLGRWRQMMEKLRMDPEQVQKIDGDVPTKEREPMIKNARIVLMTPDIVQRWLLNYSNNRRTSNTSVNNTQAACRKFLSNLGTVIIDEAHSYEYTLGANMALLMRRLRAKQQEMSDGRPLRFIGASATIMDPAVHMENLTGLTFDEVGEEDNGSPKAMLTIQHVAGRRHGAGSEEDLADIIREIIESDDQGTYIAFADDRQKVERIAAAVEPARMIHEEDIIRESENSMSYRAGLQARELIEEKLKSGQIRGLVSTSALEMGIDIPELTVGMNLGIPTSIKRMRQRAGRVGRRTPGRFIVMDDEYAFQFDEGGLKGYWERTVEPARLYLNNRFLHQIHARCLQSELDQKDIIPDMQWPEGFQAIAESLERGAPHSPDFQTLTGQDDPLEKQYPHEYDIRSFAEKQFDVLVRGDSRQITNMTKTEAMRELYTWALYHHAKQAYQVVAWNEDGTPENDTPHVIMRLAQEKNRTSRIMETGATIDLETAERTESETGILAYANSSCATGIETIVGCTRLENQDGSRKKWVEYRYCEHRDTPNIVRTAPTTLTLIQIKEDWFRDTDTREQLVTALRDIMCHLDNVNSGDLMVAHENIRTGPDEEEPRQDCIALWDRAYGGLELARILHENLLVYARRLLEITENPERTQDGTLPLRLEIARRFYEWAESMESEGEKPAAAPEGEKPATAPEGIAPIRTLYKGVTFRSQLEARWAAWFDWKLIGWEYEPVQMGNWVPDFRIVTGEEEIYVEVKPVDEFPADVAEKIDRSDWKGRTMILGRIPGKIWSREQGRWRRETDPAASGGFGPEESSAEESQGEESQGEESSPRKSNLATFAGWFRRMR